jgi:hypothetical protein
MIGSGLGVSACFGVTTGKHCSPPVASRCLEWATRQTLASTGSWLLIVDNSDDRELLFGATAFADYLLFSWKGSILFTTRNHEVAVKLVGPESYIILVEEMSRVRPLSCCRKG